MKSRSSETPRSEHSNDSDPFDRDSNPVFVRPAYEYDDVRTHLLGGDVAAHAASQQLLEVMPTHSAGVQTPDSALVAQAAVGDERALADLYDRYGGMAFSLACAIVGEQADAEEVVADAFAQVWRSASSFDAARGSVAAWLATIVRTRALDLVRSRKRRARVLEEAAVMTDEGETLVLAPSADATDRSAELTEASTIVRKSLAELPPPQRRVIELAYFGGLSQSEIAAQLSEPLGTVKTRMRAGMDKLRQALRPLLEADR